MPWTTLQNLWTRTVNPTQAPTTEEIESWNKEIKTLYELGIGMEEKLQFLYFEKPDFETYKN